MRRRILARLLVFCMVVSMMAVPTMATGPVNVTASDWTGNTYTLTADTNMTYTVSNGTYKIYTDAYYLTAESVTVESGSVLNVYYGTESDSGLLYTASGATISGDVYYNTSDSDYYINCSVTLTSTSGMFKYLTSLGTVNVSSGVLYHTLTRNVSGEYTTYTLTDSGDGGGGGGGSSGSSGTTTAKPIVEPVSSADAAAAKESGEPVALPTTVDAASRSASAAEITVDVPDSVNASNPIDVELPISNVKATTVVVIVKADGTEEIIKDAALTDKGLVFTVTGDVKVKVYDNAKTFSDSAAISSWAKESVDFVTSRELFNGTDKGFEPSISMNRGMFAQVLYNYMGRPAVSGEGFADAKGMWYNAAATWANSVGVVLGDDSGNFKGDAAITRQDLVTMLYRFASSQKFDTTLPTESVLGSFNDTANIADYAQNAMEWAVANGIMNGMDGGINPTGSATREMVAAFVARFCNNVIH